MPSCKHGRSEPNAARWTASLASSALAWLLLASCTEALGRDVPDPPRDDTDAGLCAQPVAPPSAASCDPNAEPGAPRSFRLVSIREPAGEPYGFNLDGLCTNSHDDGVGCGKLDDAEGGDARLALLMNSALSLPHFDAPDQALTAAVDAGDTTFALTIVGWDGSDDDLCVGIRIGDGSTAAERASVVDGMIHAQLSAPISVAYRVAGAGDADDAVVRFALQAPHFAMGVHDGAYRLGGTLPTTDEFVDTLRTLVNAVEGDEIERGVVRDLVDGASDLSVDGGRCNAISAGFEGELVAD